MVQRYKFSIFILYYAIMRNLETASATETQKPETQKQALAEKLRNGFSHSNMKLRNSVARTAKPLNVRQPLKPRSLAILSLFAEMLSENSE